MNGLVHKLLLQFFTLYSSKIEVPETYFFDVVTTHNDHPSYVKHVLGSIPDPPRPPPLETHFLEVLREVGRVKK